ncbi:hypothetical protein FRB99_008559 [Tulasnella sp. 403]|nr:hypothetical protein FRB99_008559 [Tulasnella sp. 403]
MSANSSSRPSSATANLKPLTLASGPRPLQLANSVASSPRTPSNASPPLATPNDGLSRSNSLNGRTASPNGNARSKRPQAKRLSSISYSISVPIEVPPSPSQSALRSAPLQHPDRHPTVSPLPPAERRRSAIAEPPKDTTETPVVFTLAEKHADLLRFIAAKEAKCLELRTQLEQHESELAVLKKKWERIASKSKTKEIHAGPVSSNSTSLNAGKEGSLSVGGEAVVEALKGVGRYFGGLGLSDDPSIVGSTSSSAKVDTASPCSLSPSPTISPLPNLIDMPAFAPSHRRSDAPQQGAQVGRAKRQITSWSSSSSVTSVSASGITSRDSLSSISTDASSLDVSGEVTPTAGRDSEQQNGAGWMPLTDGLNKKWEQIQKSTTFEKQAKRASLLLSDVSDMSHSILGSLSSVLLSPPPTKLTSTVDPSKKSNIIAARPASSSSSNRSSQVSLLDEDEDVAQVGLSEPIRPNGSTSIVPSNIAPSPPVASLASSEDPRPAEPEDEWNW